MSRSAPGLQFSPGDCSEPDYEADMTDAELHHFRDTLLALGRRIRGEEEQLSDEALRPTGASADGGAVNATGDAGDGSVEATIQDVSLGLMANERQLLAQVTAALQRIEQGTYGTCVVCGRPIGHERLEALPYTPYCVDDARTAPADPLSTGGTAGVA